MVDVVPLVDYLALEPLPHLVAHQCASCGARFFDRRNACARCSALEFTSVDIATTGTVRTFTIVHLAGPGIEVPFVAAQIDCAGTTVAANLIGVAADPERIALGMPVKLQTHSLGVDSLGVEAVGFGFTPIWDGESTQGNHL